MLSVLLCLKKVLCTRYGAQILHYGVQGPVCGHQFICQVSEKGKQDVDGLYMCRLCCIFCQFMIYYLSYFFRNRILPKKIFFIYFDWCAITAMPLNLIADFYWL